MLPAAKLPRALLLGAATASSYWGQPSFDDRKLCNLTAPGVRV
jgi:hypothetical protein